jgi:hypothetical protein
MQTPPLPARLSKLSSATHSPTAAGLGIPDCWAVYRCGHHHLTGWNIASPSRYRRDVCMAAAATSACDAALPLASTHRDAIEMERAGHRAQALLFSASPLAISTTHVQKMAQLTADIGAVIRLLRRTPAWEALRTKLKMRDTVFIMDDSASMNGEDCLTRDGRKHVRWDVGIDVLEVTGDAAESCVYPFRCSRCFNYCGWPSS